jgi:hypothetical protein
MQSLAFTIADAEDAARFEAGISRAPRICTRDKAYEVTSVTTTKSLGNES